MKHIDAIWQRRSVRRFRPDPVPADLLEAVLEAGTKAPSGGNVQPWEFIVITDEALKQRIVAETYTGFYSGPGNPQSWIATAPVLLAVLCNYKRTLARYGDDAYKWAPLDVAAATQNMLLTAVQFGLGACWIGGFREEQVTEILRLPPLVRPLGLVPLGWPAEDPLPKPRLPLRLLTHRNTYGEAYFPMRSDADEHGQVE